MNSLYYIIYILISIFITYFVGRNLHKHGRIYILMAFTEEGITDSINNVLLVGYCIINFGFILIVSKDWTFNNIESKQLEQLTSHLSLLLLTLAIIHYSNLIWIKLIQIYNQKQLSN